MSDDDMHKQISRLANIHIELPSHQHNLRAQLMARYAHQHASQNWFVSTFRILRMVKESIRTMKTNLKIASLTGIVALVSVAAFALVNLSNPQPVSAAQQQLQQTWTATQELNPQEKAELERRLGAETQRRLEEGARAKDARFMSNEEFQRITGANPETYKSELKIKDPSVANIKSFVTFRGSDGMQTIIAVGENNQPLLVLATY